jgi:glutamate-1-semialdehyde 2,1-aminomutase
MAAGKATLAAIEADAGLYERLETLGAELESGLRVAIERREAPARVQRVGSMWTLFFTEREVVDWDSAASSDRERYGRFFHAMLERGVALAPSPFEAAFLSTAHTPEDVANTIAAADAALEVALG